MLEGVDLLVVATLGDARVFGLRVMMFALVVSLALGRATGGDNTFGPALVGDAGRSGLAWSSLVVTW